MKKKTLITVILTFTIFCFIVLLKSLSTSNLYVPKQTIEKKLSQFNAKQLFSNKIISSDDVFVEDKIYMLNIWSSWCAPCRAEHKILMQLSKNPLLNIIGLLRFALSISSDELITGTPILSKCLITAFI